jgi:hypothetical protein
MRIVKDADDLTGQLVGDLTLEPGDRALIVCLKQKDGVLRFNSAGLNGTIDLVGFIEILKNHMLNSKPIPNPVDLDDGR